MSVSVSGEVTEMYWDTSEPGSPILRSGTVPVVVPDAVPDALISGGPGDTVFWGDTSVGADLALGGTASASTDNGVQPAAHVNDGNDASYWQADAVASDAWLQIDLGSSQSISRVRILFYNDTYVSADWHLDHSPDEDTWATAFTGGGGAADQTQNFVAVSARYWRVVFNDNPGNGGIAVKTLNLRKVIGGRQHLPVGAEGEVLTIVDGVPAWV